MGKGVASEDGDVDVGEEPASEKAETASSRDVAHGIGLRASASPLPRSAPAIHGMIAAFPFVAAVCSG